MSAKQTAKIRNETRRFGFDRVCDRYGEDVVRAAWLPED